jgi:hypothetical protein
MDRLWPIHTIEYYSTIKKSMKQGWRYDSSSRAPPSKHQALSSNPSTEKKKKNQWNTDTSYNVNEPQKHYTQWKKPDSKAHILWYSIYIRNKTYRIDKSIEPESRLVVVRAKGRYTGRGCLT